MAEINQKIWITWETQRRNQELAKAFECKLLVFDFSSEKKIKRYLKSAFRTFLVLLKKPNTVFAQCPSILLCLQVCLLKSIFGYQLIIDSHNAILDYQQNTNIIIRLITRYIYSKCDFMILTNIGLSNLLDLPNHKALILPDRLPEFEHLDVKPKYLSDNLTNVVFISSFAKDEPTEAFLNAAVELKSECKFFITGKKSKAKNLLKFEAENLIFTDFLSISEYENLIANADINIDLTTEDDLLVCGAYETLALGVPGILSDTEITRETFPKGFIFSKCDANSIYSAIKNACEHKKLLKEDIIEFQNEFKNKWNKQFNDCLVKLTN